VLIARDSHPSKGQSDCVKAIKIARDRQPEADLELHVAGRAGSAAAYYNSILNYISENGLTDKIHLYGQVSDMFSLRKQMDVGIVSSTNEAFGRTAIEGMLSMMAMTGRNSGGTTEQIKHKETGLLYNGTPEDLAEQLLYFYNNRSEMKKMAENGFNECVELYTNDNAARIVDREISRLF
jgi:glycosyltransferase involved in cell wall biosynthesis